MRVGFGEHLLDHAFVLLGGGVDVEGIGGLEEASAADAVVLAGAELLLVDFEFGEFGGLVEVVVDLVVVLRVVLGLYASVEGFVLSLCALSALRSCHF